MENQVAEIKKDSGIADMHDQDGAVIGRMTWERAGKICTITHMEFDIPLSASAILLTLPFDTSKE